MAKSHEIPTNLNPGEHPVLAVIHSSTEGDWDDSENWDPRVKAAERNNALLFMWGALPSGVVFCHDAVKTYEQILKPKNTSAATDEE